MGGKTEKAIKRGNGRKRVRRRGIGKKIKTKRWKEKKGGGGGTKR